MNNRIEVYKGFLYSEKSHICVRTHFTTQIHPSTDISKSYISKYQFNNFKNCYEYMISLLNINCKTQLAKRYIAYQGSIYALI